MKSAEGKTISLEARRWAVSQSLQDAQSPTEVNECVSPFVCNSAGCKCTFAHISIRKHAGARERVSSLASASYACSKTFLERVWPTCQATFLLGANSFWGRQQSIVLLFRCHLDSDFDRFHHFSQLGVGRRGAIAVRHLVVAAVASRQTLALLFLVLDEEQNVPQWEG